MGTISAEELAQWEKTEGGGGVGGRGGGGKEKIFVSVRIRPLNAKEIERGDPSDWECINSTTIISKNSVAEKSMYPITCTYDRVFGVESSTRRVYDEGAKEVALSVVNGINSSVFAYGQTSSGKTYTMTGITEYTVADVYDYIKKHEEREFILKFSAMEIYNEAVRDLLSMDSTPLRLLDDPERGTIVEKLTEETPRDQNHLKELLSICAAQRQIGETSLNEMSSRSHQILRLTIESSARKFVSRDRSSTLAATVNFVDLAGSERASQTLSAGARLKEGCHINRSLLTLGTVIRKLSKGRNAHVPYRDSKLTRILQSSLGGNAKTAIICTMSPARSHMEQTRNTLLFASCAKEVVTNAKVNVVMSDKALVKHLRRELARLENELRNPSCTSHYEALKDKESQIKQMEREIKELMHQRDLAQSRLEDLLRNLGDDAASRQSDGSSQSSISHEHTTSEDTLSVSEISSIAYQDQDFYTTRFNLYNDNNNHNAFHWDPSNTINGQRASISKPISSSEFIGIIPEKTMVEIYEAKIGGFGGHCKEARCIEIHAMDSSNADEFNLLLTEESDTLLPLTDEDKLESTETKTAGHMHWKPVVEQLVESFTRINDNFVKSSDDEQLPSLMQRATSSKELGLKRSRSCNGSLMMSPNSWLEELEQENAKVDNNSPASNVLRELYGKPEGIRRRLSELNYDAEKGLLYVQASETSERHSFSDAAVAQDVQSVPEDIIADISNSCAELDKMTQRQCQKQLSHEEEIRQEEGEKVEVPLTGNDAHVESMLSSLASPLTWAVEFEKKQLEIIELWHACNVSLVHRTCFFLLFRGDPADTYYMEVEYRRLSFLRNSSSDVKLANIFEDGDTSSLKHIRREREMLHRQMLKKLISDERKSLYTKWGIALNSKQRRLQLAKQIWTKTEIEHVKESALLVAKLVGLPDQGQAPKEMFGLSFTPQRISRRSFSWMQVMPSLT